MKNSILKIMCAVLKMALALVLLPFYLVMWCFYIIGIGLIDFKNFSKDFIGSLTDPDYVPPIGLGGFYALKGYRLKALEAESAGNSDDALKYWKKCACFYDSFAMCKVASYTLYGEDEEQCRKKASEWYAAAASFGNEEAEKEYKNITGVPLDDKQKRWIRKNFINNRRHYLAD